jgi:predicted SAM-dependent methyltransferase
MIFKTFLRPFKRILYNTLWKIKRLIFVSDPKNNERVMLHLGCGPIDVPGYINVDIKSFPHVHYVHDVFPLEIFESNKFELVYASHILEHFSIPEVPSVLQEWHRILKPGGILRLGVPDFPTIIEIYQNTKDIKEIQGPLMGGQTDIFNFHKSVYDKQFISLMLHNTGFREVRHWNPALVENHDFNDTTTNIWLIGDKNYAISLNIEAVK